MDYTLKMHKVLAVSRFSEVGCSQYEFAESSMVFHGNIVPVSARTAIFRQHALLPRIARHVARQLPSARPFSYNTQLDDVPDSGNGRA